MPTISFRAHILALTCILATSASIAASAENDVSSPDRAEDVPWKLELLEMLKDASPDERDEALKFIADETFQMMIGCSGLRQDSDRLICFNNITDVAMFWAFLHNWDVTSLQQRYRFD